MPPPPHENSPHPEHGPHHHEHPHHQPPRPWSSHSMEWGIGSIILGVLVIFTVPFGLMSAAVGITMAQMPWNEESLRTTSIGANIALGVVSGLTLACLLAAVIGLMNSLFRRLPAGLSAVGLMLGLMAVGAVVFGFFVVGAVRDDVTQHLHQSKPTIQVPGARIQFP